VPKRKPWTGFYTIAYLRARCVANQEGCWIWTGALAHGYGVIGRNQTGSTNVHKVMYILTFGLVPKGMELDHTCRNRNCCNPEHLEPVTHLENCRRGIARCAKLTECHREHPFEEGSYYIVGGRRVCKKCNTIRSREYSEAHKHRPTLLDFFPASDTKEC
jgi:hypothetical protein